MIRLTLVATLLASWLGVLPLDQQPGAWFPPSAREGLARDLAPRLERIQIGIEKGELLNAARRSVSEMGLRLDTIGVEKLIGMAPAFAKLDLPSSGQKHLDAMGRLGLCTYYLEARYANPAGLDEDARIDAAIGPMTLALSTMFLRDDFLKHGGTDVQIKSYLAGDPLNAVAARVQTDAALLAYTAGECKAVVSALLD